MKAFVFDVDDTLYDRSMPFLQTCRALYKDRYEGLETALYWATTRRGDEVFEAAQTGKMDMEAAHIYRFQKGFADLGIAITEREAVQFRRTYEKKQQEIEMSGEMKMLLDFCGERGIPMGVITNGTKGHQQKKIERLGVPKWIPAQRIVISGACGIRKPDPQIFVYAREQMGLQDHTCYYIGDSYENDIPGAAAAGWKTVWLDKRGGGIQAGQTAPDYIVRNERELRLCIQGIPGERNEQ